jgi:hypothetical protein
VLGKWKFWRATTEIARAILPVSLRHAMLPWPDGKSTRSRRSNSDGVNSCHSFAVNTKSALCATRCIHVSPSCGESARSSRLSARQACVSHGERMLTELRYCHAKSFGARSLEGCCGSIILSLAKAAYYAEDDDPRACIHVFAPTIRGELGTVSPFLRPVSA